MLARISAPQKSGSGKTGCCCHRKFHTVAGAASHPQVGRPAGEMDIEYRELPIDFGDSGYVALYRYEDALVTVLSLRYQKEAGC